MKTLLLGKYCILHYWMYLESLSWIKSTHIYFTIRLSTYKASQNSNLNLSLNNSMHWLPHNTVLSKTTDVPHEKEKSLFYNIPYSCTLPTITRMRNTQYTSLLFCCSQFALFSATQEAHGKLHQHSWVGVTRYCSWRANQDAVVWKTLKIIKSYLVKIKVFSIFARSLKKSPLLSQKLLVDSSVLDEKSTVSVSPELIKSTTCNFLVLSSLCLSFCL